MARCRPARGPCGRERCLVTFDLGVWRSRGSISAISASRVYGDLCRGITSDRLEEGGTALQEFYAELIATWPEPEPASRLRRAPADTPWAAPVVASSRYVLLSALWEHAEVVLALVTALASKHGLAVFDPQGEEVYLPDVRPAE
jgi:hypothetical protein